MGECPFFSIILPVYNVEKYLGECLDSIYRQSFKDFEIIAVNDGSTDGSLSILKKYKFRYGKMKIVSQYNKGLSGARNEAFNHVNGEWILFMDSDDAWVDDALEVIHSKCSWGKDMVIFGCKRLYDVFKKEDYLIEEKNSVSYTEMSGKEMFSYRIDSKRYGNEVWLYALLRDFYKKNKFRFIEKIYYEDVLFTIDCHMSAKDVVYIDKDIYLYRQRKGSISLSGNNERCINSYEIILRRMKEYIQDINIEDKIKLGLLEISRQLLYELKQKAVEEMCILREYEDIYKENISLICSELDEKVMKNTKIIIYGAGEIGTLVGRYLSKKGIYEKVECYCVTEHREYDEIGRKKVICVDNIEREFLGNMVIIASNNGAKEMRSRLEKIGIKNYYIVGRALECAMAYYVDGKNIC